MSDWFHTIGCMWIAAALSVILAMLIIGEIQRGAGIRRLKKWHEDNASTD